MFELGFVSLSVFMLLLTGNAFLKLVFVHSVATIQHRHTFALTFALSALIFLMVLSDILDLLSGSTSRWIMTIALYILLLLTTLLLPFWSVAALVGDFLWAKRRILRYVCSLATLVVIYFLTYQMLPHAEAVPVTPSKEPEGANDKNNERGMSFAEYILAGAACHGVSFMALLGGFAVVATPIGYLAPFFARSSKESAHQLLLSLMKRQQHIIDLWATKKGQIVAALEKQNANGGDGAASGGAMSGITSWLRNPFSSDKQNIANLKIECEGLERLSTGLFVEIHEAEQSYHAANFGRSIYGIIYATFGVILSIYCVGKLFWSVLNLALGRFSTVDPVTRFFDILVYWTGINIDAASLVFRVSICFNAVMIMSAIRGFLLMIFRISTKHLSGVVSANTTVLFFTTSMGLYAIAMLLLMRLSLPVEYRSVLTDVIGPLPFYYYHRWHDVLFVIAAVATYCGKKLADV